MEMRYDVGQGMYFPQLLGRDLIDNSCDAFEVCPGKGYPIIELSSKFETGEHNKSVELGVWHKVWAAQSTDSATLERATSGGVMTAVAEYLMTIGAVDGAIVTGMQYGPLGPRPKAYIARTREGLFSAQ
ncbi:MAG: coenzyme F420 hydrogenase/dehydrogenase beta subunit N-terminal domain-containing protein, partial [Candidatus Subteraquimicrobiales bacterium]|nr:coenzyme F420 hydrogenase/dehydrogenase beta subunit N-terminal domain-containing protein [Candidatus Subteraquimicrobiales bacterium]